MSADRPGPGHDDKSPPAAADQGDGRGGHDTGRPDGPGEADGQRRAETRTREEYAEAMPVTDQQAAALRAQLAGDLAGHKRLLAGLHGAADGRGYSALLTAAFYNAVDSRFSRDSTMAEVTGFVADVRASSEGVRDALDPQTAERVVVSAFTSDDLDDLDAGELTRTKMMLLAGIIAGQHLDNAGLDEFIAKARALADELLS